MVGREAENTKVIVLDLIQMGLESHADHYTNNADLWSQLTTDMFRLSLSQSDPFLILDYQGVCSKSNTTDITSRGRNCYLSGKPEFIPGVKWGSCCSIFSFLCSVL